MRDLQLNELHHYSRHHIIFHLVLKGDAAEANASVSY